MTIMLLHLSFSSTPDFHGVPPIYWKKTILRRTKTMKKHKHAPIKKKKKKASNANVYDIMFFSSPVRGILFLDVS